MTATGLGRRNTTTHSEEEEEEEGDSISDDQPYMQIKTQPALCKVWIIRQKVLLFY